MRFLHITTFYPPYSFGGDAVYLERLCHALGDAGHEVDVVHCEDSFHLLHPAEPRMKPAEHPRVHRHGLRSGAGFLSPLLAQQTGRPFLKTKALQELVNSNRYDVIHFHNMSLFGPQTLALDSPGSETVKMYTAHEHWLVCPMHVLWKFNSRACEKPECLRCTLQGKRPPQLWRYTGMLDKYSRHVDQFVSPSRFTVRMHKERGFKPPLEHLPYFLDAVDEDWQRPGPSPQERPYFLFVGRLEYIKGLHTLIDAWTQVTDYDLLIAGTGTFESELRRQAAGNERIRFLGMQGQKQLAAYYYHARAVIVPSVTYETFGIIIIEAFARKTPVIVRNLGALPEVVQDSGGGFIYDTDRELIEAISALGQSVERRRELGEKGYSAFRKYWCKEAHLELYYSFLSNCAIKKFGRVPWEDPSRVSPDFVAQI